MKPLVRATPTLIGIPHNLLLKILGYTPFPSYFTIRKVCTTLRTFIIFYKPTVDASLVQFTVNEEGTKFFLDDDLHSMMICIRQDQSLDEFFKNIRIILDHVKVRLLTFEVKLLLDGEETQNARLLEFLEDFLKSRKNKLDVSSFETNALNRMAPIIANLHEDHPMFETFLRFRQWT